MRSQNSVTQRPRERALTACAWCCLAMLLSLLLPGPARGGDADTGDPDGREARNTEAEATQQPFWRSLVPLPTIITEPAIGEGLGLAVAYFHPEKQGAYQPRSIEHTETLRDVSVARKPPPTVTGVFGAYTNKGTWAAGFGHVNTFRNDTIRYTGAVAKASVVMDFYLLNQPFEFNIEGLIVYNDVKFRLARSNWFLGLGLTYLSATNRFAVDIPVSFDQQVEFFAYDFTDVGLKARAMYETRDDSLMPTSGWLVDASLTRNDEALGGSYDYTTAKLKALYFHPLADDFVLGARLETSAVYGAPPFFAVPWVTMRGIPAMRYQGENVAVAEIEGRYRFNDNWLASAFAGSGWTAGEILGIETDQSIRAWGIGARYRFLKKQNVWVGIDYAFGPEDNVYYIKVGQGW